MSGAMIYSVGALVFAVIVLAFVLWHTFKHRHVWVIDSQITGWSYEHCLDCGERRVVNRISGRLANHAK